MASPNLRSQIRLPTSARYIAMDPRTLGCEYSAFTPLLAIHPKLPRLIFLILLPFSHASCFLPNGTISPSLGAQPCSSDHLNPLNSTCCNTVWTNPPGSDVKFGSTKDICLRNGLCQNTGFSTIVGKEQPPWTHFYRNYCAHKEGVGCLGVCDTGASA